MKKTLNIIGCGNAAKALGLLWSRAGVFEILGILNRTAESGARAAVFLGRGSPAAQISDLPPAEIFFIATPDSAIEPTARALADSSALAPGNIVFHCSGALSSDTLDAVRVKGAVVASVHPLRSFADASTGSENFAGTYCGIEGDPEALSILLPAIERIGGRPLHLSTGGKPMYHAAMVMASNYLASLLEISLRMLAKSEIPQAQALEAVEPLVRGTIDNIFRTGTVQALTGPIARGDSQTVRLHLEQLDPWNGEYAELYRRLGKTALELAEKKGGTDPAKLAAVAALLEPRIAAG